MSYRTPNDLEFGMAMNDPLRRVAGQGRMAFDSGMDTISPTIGKYGKYGRNAAIGLGGAAALYGAGRYIASPIVGGMVDPEFKESVGNTGVGQFLTGWDPNSQALQEKILEKKENELYGKERERINEERAYLEDAYQRKAEYDTQLAYNQAVKQTGLALGAGGVQSARDTYASGLRNEVDNYLKSLQIANQGVANILSYQVQPM